MPTAEVRLALAGSHLAYAVETTAGTMPSTGWAEVPEVTSIPELASAEFDQIDMTPINATKSHITINGLRAAPGTLAFEANLSDTLLTFWNTTLMTAYTTANADGKAMWFAVILNGMDKAYCFTAKPTELTFPGGDVSNGLKCNLPITPTNEADWYDAPTLPVLGG